MSEMRKLVFFMDTGLCGTDAVEFVEVPVGYTDDRLHDMAWLLAKENAEMYGIYYPEDFQDETEEQLEAQGIQLSWDIAGWWEDYDPAAHDDLAMGSEPEWSQSAVY